MKKTNYLIPQTEIVSVHGERLLQGFGPTGDIGQPAPERGGYAPGGGDLGGVPAR